MNSIIDKNQVYIKSRKSYEDTYPWMTYSDMMSFANEARSKGVSKVALGDEPSGSTPMGFTQAYKLAVDNYGEGINAVNAMHAFPSSSGTFTESQDAYSGKIESWAKRRHNFIGRHLPTYLNDKSRVRERLSLIMWAYNPDYK